FQPRAPAAYATAAPHPERHGLRLIACRTQCRPGRSHDYGIGSWLGAAGRGVVPSVAGEAPRLGGALRPIVTRDPVPTRGSSFGSLRMTRIGERRIVVRSRDRILTGRTLKTGR